MNKGVVCSAFHVPTSQRVAIKKITPFDHSSLLPVPLAGRLSEYFLQCFVFERFAKCKIGRRGKADESENPCQ